MALEDFWGLSRLRVPYGAVGRLGEALEARPDSIWVAGLSANSLPPPYSRGSGKTRAISETLLQWLSKQGY